MSAFVIGGAVIVGGAAIYASSSANSAADQRASDANAANQASADRSRELSTANTATRRAELLRRFDVKSAKTVDTNQQINIATAINLTEFDMQMASAQSVTDNALATRQITGRLAERLRAAQSIQGDMKKGTIVQSSEAKHREIGDNLEMMRMNYESEEMNVNIDLANSINSANNQEVRGWTASQSTGSAGVISSGISGAASGASAGAGLKSAFA